jgi:hypothetical protein
LRADRTGLPKCGGANGNTKCCCIEAAAFIDRAELFVDRSGARALASAFVEFRQSATGAASSILAATGAADYMGSSRGGSLSFERAGDIGAASRSSAAIFHPAADAGARSEDRYHRFFLLLDQKCATRDCLN